MTQKEFTERTGYTPTAEEFDRINDWYMNTDLNKDVFCNAWKHERDLLSEIEIKTVFARNLDKQRSQMADFLIEQADKWSASDLMLKAIQIVGEREYLRRKIAKGYKLWAADKELLMEVLRG